jgi:hypothetical protein
MISSCRSSSHSVASMILETTVGTSALGTFTFVLILLGSSATAPVSEFFTRHG